MNGHSTSEKRHPIQVVAKRTGLTADVLRVWEKRYEVVEPGRSSGGHRLYSDQDVELLGLLKRATSAGRRISRVADMSLEELQGLVQEDAAAAVHRRREMETGLSSAPEVYLAACLTSVDTLDAARLEMTLMRAAVALSAPMLIEEVVAPLLAGIGDRWQHGKLSPGHEHLASAVIRRVLESLASSAMPGPGAPGLVVGTPAGQAHEFGALFVSAAAAVQGWHVTYLGASLPAADFGEVTRATAAAAVAVSLVFQTDDPSVAKELEALRAAIGPDLPILVGGRAAPAYRDAIESIDARLVSNLEDLQKTLAAIEQDSIRV